MQTWIRANIGKLIDRITKAETAIGKPYENETDLDSRTTALENAVGMPYSNPLNLDTRVYNLELAPAYSDDYTQSKRAVGKWIDGKTIYKYTASHGDLPSQSSVLFTPGGGHVIDKFIKAEYIYSYVDNTYNFQFIDLAGNDRVILESYLDKNNNQIVTNFHNPDAYKSVYITYWFTETTAQNKEKE